MRKIDYSFLKDQMVPADFVRYSSEMYRLRERAAQREAAYENAFSVLEKVARLQSVQSSNAIEGVVTTDDRLHAIVEQDCPPLSHDEYEIAGYRDALDLIHSEYEKIDFTEETILRLHKMVKGGPGNDGGQYKTVNNLIVEIAADGSRNIRFRPVPAEDTPEAMEQLVLAYSDAACTDEISPLLLIPCVILDFLCIHPFTDGNGRVSRLLSLLLLYKSGFDAGKYVSFEDKINTYKDLYYDALQESSKGWDVDENTYFPFIKNFLSTLYMCYKELDQRFSIINGKRISKKDRIAEVIRNSLTPVSKADICMLLPDVSPTTVESALSEFLHDGSIRKVGKGRNTKYVKTF